MVARAVRGGKASGGHGGISPITPVADRAPVQRRRRHDQISAETLVITEARPNIASTSKWTMASSFRQSMFPICSM